jgi:hypothetical protein
MSVLKVSTLIDAPRSEVWNDLSDLSSHVEWMRDARSITFVTDSTSGVGTAFDCETRVGPFRLNDRMEITRWDEGTAIGVRHVGLVTGEGVISLHRRRRGRTRVVWRERLRFPWWMGGPVGAWLATPVLWAVWRSSMRTLAERFR